LTIIRNRNELFPTVVASGDIDVHELGEAIHILGVDLSSEEVVLFLDQIDLNLNGKISFKEFVVAVEDRKRVAVKKKISNRSSIEYAWKQILVRVDDDPEEWDRTVGRIFDRLDDDGSGYLDSRELGEHLHSLGVNLTNEELMLFLDECDFNLDGRISFKEFMASVCERKPAEAKHSADAKRADAKRDAKQSQAK